MSTYLRRSRNSGRRPDGSPTDIATPAQTAAEPSATTSTATPRYTDDLPPVQLAPDATAAAPAHEDATARQEVGEATAEDRPPEWVLSILGDDNMTLITKLRALYGDRTVGEGPKGEDELVESLLAANKEEPPAAEEGRASSADIAEHFIRKSAVEKAQSLMGADWNASTASAAGKKADILHNRQFGLPQDARSKAMQAGMLWAFEQQESIEKIQREAERRYKEKKSLKARETAEAAAEVLAALGASLNASLGEHQHSSGSAEFADNAWRYLGSEKSKKYLEKLGFPLAWFTTCVTLVNPVVTAAGVDTKRWGPLDMFDKKRQERFKETQASEAWVPADKKETPKPGDIIIFVSYPKEKGVVQKEMAKATFQHVAVLAEPVTKKDDGLTERWVTFDGGKGSSHKGEDKTGTTDRRYNPVTQQFIADKQTNLQEAAEGGRYLLGFWSLPRLPRAPDPPPKPPKKK